MDATLKLDTIILFVKDVDNLRSFYTNILKLQVIEDQGPLWVLLQAGNGKIGLHKIGNEYLDKDKFKFDNNTKIVFEIDKDIRKIREGFINQNVFMKEIKTFDNYGYWLCDGEDPEGNIFQLKQKK